MRLAVMVHGGAGALSDAGVKPARAGCEAAARAGMAVLAAGGSALDAVEAATRVLEDDPHFNAGTGSVLTAEGRVEMDALIMDGADLRAGAVAGVTRVANPVSAARAIMEHTPHVLMVGPPAEEVAFTSGVPRVDPSTLVTAHRVQQLKSALQAAPPDGGGAAMAPMARALLAPAPPPVEGSARGTQSLDEPCAGDHDTVGAVAIDALGRVAAAVSTGGLTGKRPGRVGDTPCVGCGAYADVEVGASVTTGVGEHILRVCLARLVCEQYARITERDAEGAAPSPGLPTCEPAHAPPAPPNAPSSDLDPGGVAVRAVEGALAHMNRKIQGNPGAGVVFVTPRGGMCAGHASARMSWAAAYGEAVVGRGGGGEDAVQLRGGGYWAASGVQQRATGVTGGLPLIRAEVGEDCTPTWCAHA